MPRCSCPRLNSLFTCGLTRRLFRRKESNWTYRGSRWTGSVVGPPPSLYTHPSYIPSLHNLSSLLP